MNKELWTFKYEPQTMKDFIVTDNKKLILEKIIKELPNTLIAGKPGTGKGTFLNILLRSSDVDVLKINGSDETGIDNLRDKVKKFSCSFSTSIKIVYLNECDRLSPNAQNLLNQVVEDTQSITRFFFVCNNPQKISAPLISRCGFQLDFNDPPPKMIYSFLANILKKEKIKINKSIVVDLIKKCYPDIRQMVGKLQSCIIDNKLTKPTTNGLNDVNEKIKNCLIEGDIDKIRVCLKSSFIDYDSLYQYLYKEVMTNPDIIKEGAGDFIIDIGEYLYRNSFVSIKEINFMAFVFTCLQKGYF